MEAEVQTAAAAEAYPVAVASEGRIEVAERNLVAGHREAVAEGTPFEEAAADKRDSVAHEQ